HSPAAAFITPPSFQASDSPVPIFSLIIGSAALPSLKRRKPLVRLFGASGLLVSSALIVIIPALSGLVFTLYQKVALNSSPVNPLEGKVRYAPSAPAYALLPSTLSPANPGLPTTVMARPETCSSKSSLNGR